MTIQEMQDGSYYLVKHHGLSDVAIVRAGKMQNDKSKPYFGLRCAYMGRALVHLTDADIVRLADKSERDTRNYHNLVKEVFG